MTMRKWSVVCLRTVLAFRGVVGNGYNEGMAIWARGDGDTVAYALWNGTEFSSSHPMPIRSKDEQTRRILTSVVPVMPGAETIGWEIIRGAYSPIRDEAVFLGLTRDSKCTVQLYSGGQWAELPFSPLEGLDRPKWVPFAFDVRYESQSGNPLIVWYEQHNSTMSYASWTGSKWSLGTVEAPAVDHCEINLEANPHSNEMVLVVAPLEKSKYAIVWDGNRWGEGLIFDSVGGVESTFATADVAYEQQSGRALIIYSDMTSVPKYRIWNSATWWSKEGSISPPAGTQGNVKFARINADPDTNRIVAVIESPTEAWVTVWDGNDNWGSTAQVALERPGYVYSRPAVAFEGASQRAVVVYVSRLRVMYRKWSSKSGWSTEERVPIRTSNPLSMMLYGSNDVMLAVSDEGLGVCFFKWSDSGWVEVKRAALAPTWNVPNQPLSFLWKPTTRSESNNLTGVDKATRVTAGRPCVTDEECESNTCRNGVCMATSACYPLRHDFGDPFFEHKVNIVFVASGFDTATMEEWHAQVNSTYKSFEEHNMFSNKVEQLNMFRVDPWQLDSSYCALECLGLTRLLCCDQRRALSLAQQCFSVGSNLQTVVIHNDKRYGGGGYVEYNIATVTTHHMAPVVAAHELAHSLFDLTDEYSYGPGTDKDPNCASTRSCDKWSDLIGNTPAGYDRVRCLPGCRNGNFYVATLSFMNVLNRTMGAVNDRFTCCTYLALTKSFPSYCDVFNTSTNYLLNYCKNNDYQGYGSASYDKDPIHSISAFSLQDSSTKYVQVGHPVLVSITTKKKRSGVTVCRSKQYPLEPGMFLRSRVEGDFSSPRMAVKQGYDSLYKVILFYGTWKKALFYSRNTTIEVPISLDPADDVEPLVVSEQAQTVHIIADTNGKRIKKIRVKVVDL